MSTTILRIRKAEAPLFTSLVNNERLPICGLVFSNYALRKILFKNRISALGEKNNCLFRNGTWTSQPLAFARHFYSYNVTSRRGVYEQRKTLYRGI